MSDKYAPVKGDRVRVVLEGEVDFVGRNGNFDVDGEFSIYPSENVVSVEKIEPAVEFFLPGDLVEYKDSKKYRYFLAKDGYVDVLNGILEPMTEESMKTTFSSKHYQKVE